MVASQRQLHVAYVTVGSATDVHQWSGLNAAIRASMIGAGCHVTDVDNLIVSYPISMRVRKRVADAVLGTTYALDRSPYAVRRWSREASERVAALEHVDAVVSTGTLPVAQLTGAIPLAIWADATFHALRTTYPEFARYSTASIQEGEAAERAAYSRARLLCFASEWAAADAIEFYGVDASKVRVVPFGANVVSPFADDAAAAAAVSGRDWSTVRFAFVGVDWQRKGGDTAVAIVRRLNDVGIPAVLTIVGCEPPAAVASLPYVECEGFLSKKQSQHSQRLAELMSRSHFLLVPTLAECFGLVFAEASAHALPSIAHSVGGTSTPIRDGVTGVLLRLGASVDESVGQLWPLITDRSRYAAMCGNAYTDYRNRLNWRVAGLHFVEELRAAIARSV